MDSQQLQVTHYCVILVLGDLMLSSGLFGHQTHMYKYIHAGKTFIYINVNISHRKGTVTKTKISPYFA